MGYKLLRRRGPVSKKAQVEVITVMLILAITVAAVFVAYQFAAPQIERSRDISRINSMQNALLELDSKIREVRFEGEGAQRYIDINFDKGNLRVNQNEDSIWFYMSAPGIESASQQTGMDTYFSGRTINIKLQYGGEIDVLSRFEVLNAGQYRIYIKNEGANDILLSLSPEIPITGDTWTLQGYVYDNSEGQTVGDAIMGTDVPVLANSEIIFINDKLQTIAVTRTNSQGRYAVKLPKSDGPNDLKLYIRVNLSSYVMKENDGSIAIYTKTDQYKKGFKKNLGPWIVNINPSIGKNDNDFETYYDANGFLNIPMYKLTKQDIFESVPIAVILYAEGPTEGGYRINSGNELGHLLYDVMDAFDSSPTSNYNCNYFVVYGSVDNRVGLRDKNGNPINYPNTTINVEIYPINWLLDTTERKSPSDYSTLNPIFADIAAIDGNPNILNYRDFSLIIVGSGATNDSKLLPKINAYRGDLTNFLTLNRLSFKGVDYSRGLVTFGQFSIVNNVDPDMDNYLPYPSVGDDITPPKIINTNIAPDGQNIGVPPVQHPYVWINDSGGKLVFYSNVKDQSDIIYAGVNIYNPDGSLKGSTYLFDDGRRPDILYGDSTYSAEWIIPSGSVEGTYKAIFNATDEYGNYEERSSFNPNDTSSEFKFQVVKDITPPPDSPIFVDLGLKTTSEYNLISSTIQDSMPLSSMSGIKYSFFGSQMLQYSGTPLWQDPHTYYHYMPLIDGHYNYSIITYDRAQNILIQEKKQLLKDTMPPSILADYSPQGIVYTGTPLITVNYLDTGAGIRGSRLYLDIINVNENGPMTSSISYTPPIAESNGTHTSSVYVEDDLGNFVVFPWKFSINSQGPDLQINYPQSLLTFTRDSSLPVYGTTSTTGTIWLDTNAGVSIVGSGNNFNFTNVTLDPNSINIILIEANGSPISKPNTNEIRWVIMDEKSPIITNITNLVPGGPQNVKPGTKAYVTFTYNEKYPASYMIKIFNSLNSTQSPPIVINEPGSNFVKAGGQHTIIGAIEIPSDFPNGLYDVNITMIDLAGNKGTLISPSGLIRVKNYPPEFSNPSPLPNTNTSSISDPITLTITDVNAGIDRNSIRMFIKGQSNNNVSVINMEVTNNLLIESPNTNTYRITYQPTWAWENTNKITVSVEASDKIGNIKTSSWEYYTKSDYPKIVNVSKGMIGAERKYLDNNPYIVELTFDVTQCANQPDTFDAIKEININVGKLGYIKYVSDGIAGKSKLVRTVDSLPGSPSFIEVNHSMGGCTGSNLFTYSFKNNNKITFTVPQYAGDLNNKIFISTINNANWESFDETFLVTSKLEYPSLPNTFYYGKYSWLPSFQGADLSIGRVSNEPIGLNYKIYGQVNDVHRNIPVIYTAWRRSRGPGQHAPIVREDWSGALYIDKDGERIEWDHGKIPEVFNFNLNAPIGTTWPRGRPFQAFAWLNEVNLDLELSDSQRKNLQKSSLENPIVNRLPNDFSMCAHNYFDITDTGWTNNNFIISLKTFEGDRKKVGADEELTPNGPFTTTGGTIFVPKVNGGPVLLIKERRNIFNSLESTIIVTTLDLDRYKNNRNLMGLDMHPNVNYQYSPRKLQQNIIVYACGHEILLD